MPVINLFPCTVTGPDGVVWQTCRVTSGAQGTTVWWWDRDVGDAVPVITSPEALVQNAPNSRNYTLTLDNDDRPVNVIRSTGCGCGHPMKRWQLPKPVRESA